MTSKNTFGDIYIEFIGTGASIDIFILFIYSVNKYF